VKITFQSLAPTAPAYVQRWWNDKLYYNLADPIPVNGNVTNINEVMDAGYRISGRVTDSANPAVGLPDVFVDAQPNFSCCFYGIKTVADGGYSVVVSAATYRISFFPPAGTDFLEQWWNGRPGFGTADLVTVPSTTVDLSAINAALVHGIPVAGTVTDASTGAAVAGVGVVADRDDPPSCCLNYQALTGADGRYTMYVSAGTYRVNFQPPNTTDYVIEYWHDRPNRDQADLLSVTGPLTGIDARLERGFRISGRVTDAANANPLSSSIVTINPQGCCQAFTIVGTAADGTYSVLVRAGSYKIGFNPPYGTDFVQQFWDAKPDLGSADVLVVDSAQPNISAALAHGIRLTGRVTDAANPAAGVAGVNVTASTSPGGQFVANTATMADGTYSLFVPPGTYTLFFYPQFGSDFVSQYWNNKPDLASADPIVVTGPMNELNARLTHAVHISGRVTDEAGQPIAGVNVNIDNAGLPFTFVTGPVTDADGRYSGTVPPGSYKVYFFTGSLPYVPEWWNDKASFTEADPIDATASVGAINAVLARGVVISGHVTSTGGAPLPGAIVYIAPGDRACCVFSAGYAVQASGAYSFTVRAGSYFLGFYADGYTFQYWDKRTAPTSADLLSVNVDHPNTDAVLAPIDASSPASSVPPTDGSPPGSSAPPNDGTLPAGSPTDGTPGASGAAADDRVLAMGIAFGRSDASWSRVGLVA